MINPCPEPPEWLDDQVGGQFYGYVTGTANLTCQAEAEPPPTFSMLKTFLSALEKLLTRITRSFIRYIV